MYWLCIDWKAKKFFFDIKASGCLPVIYLFSGKDCAVEWACLNHSKVKKALLNPRQFEPRSSKKFLALFLPVITVFSA